MVDNLHQEAFKDFNELKSRCWNCNRRDSSIVGVFRAIRRDYLC